MGLRVGRWRGRSGTAASATPPWGHARLAVTLAQTDRERQQAQQMLDFFVKNAAAPR
jgi:hypothetical protein